MDKQEAIDIMNRYNRMSIIPSLAQEISNSFDVVFNEMLIYTENKYRETSNGLPRVAVYQLVEWICKVYKIEPDERLMKISNSQLGHGSSIEYTTRAYLKPLAKYFDLRYEDD